MSSGSFSRGVSVVRAWALSILTSMLVGTLALVFSGGAFAQCKGPGAPAAGSPWQCLTAIQVPGNPLTAFDISNFNPSRNEYYLADRSNAAIDVVNTTTNTFKAQISGFVGAVLSTSTTAPNTLNNNVSGPDGVASFGKWLYAGDGNSTLKVIDLTKGAIVQSVPTGGQDRVDEMALTGIMGNGQQWLLAANNADNPPFATLFLINGNNVNNNIQVLARIYVDPSIIPPGSGLSLEAPSWNPDNKRFYVSIPQINYPAGCAISTTAAAAFAAGTVPCQGGLLVVDPSGVQAPNCTSVSGIPVIGSVCQYTYTFYNGSQNIGVLPLVNCGPNGSTVGPAPDGIGRNVLLGCTPGNDPNNVATQVINSNTVNWSNIGNITGSDEVWFNSGDDHYYAAASKNPTYLGGPALGIIDANANILVSTIPEGSGSHSVAADSNHNTIYVPQVVPYNPSNTAEPGAGSGDTTGVSLQLCGGNNGCIVVYQFTPPPPPPITD
jgi:hypothetical protein